MSEKTDAQKIERISPSHPPCPDPFLGQNPRVLRIGGAGARPLFPSIPRRPIFLDFQEFI